MLVLEVKPLLVAKIPGTSLIARTPAMRVPILRLLESMSSCGVLPVQPTPALTARESS